MTQSLYKVVISGSITGKPEEVAAKLATLLNIPNSKALELLKKVPTALDKVMPLTTAQQYQSRLKEAGILCALEPTDAANDDPAAEEEKPKDALETGMFTNLSLEDVPELTEEPAQDETTPESQENINDQFAQISNEIGDTINVMEESSARKSKEPAPVAPGNMRCPQCKTEQKKAPVCSNCNADIAALISGKKKPAPAEQEEVIQAPTSTVVAADTPKPTRRKPPPPAKPKFTGFTFFLILGLAGVLGGTYFLQTVEQPEQRNSADSTINDLNKTRNKLTVLRDSFKNMVVTAKNIDSAIEIPTNMEQVISFLNLRDRDIKDSWGNMFIFKIEQANYSFTSKGRDEQINSRDDIVMKGVLSIPVTTTDEPVEDTITDGTGETTTTDPATGTTQPSGQTP